MNQQDLIDRVLEDTGATNGEKVLGDLVATVVQATVASLVEAELIETRSCPHCGARLLGPTSIDTPTVRGCPDCGETIESGVRRG